MNGVIVDSTSRPAWRSAWLLLRVPVLIISVFLARHRLLDLLDRVSSVSWITHRTIDLLSTPTSRVIEIAVLTAVLWAVGLCARRSGLLRGYVVALVISALVIYIVGRLTWTPSLWRVLVLLLLAVNWAPQALWARIGLRPTVLDRIGTWVPLLPEVLAADRWWALLRGRGYRQIPLFGAGLAAIALSVCANRYAMVPFERAVRAGQASEVVAYGEFNGLILSDDGRYLYASGQGFSGIRRYEVENPTAPHLASTVEGSGTQGFAYDGQLREIMYFRRSDRALVALDSDTLALKRLAFLPDMSPGDTWIVYQRGSDTVTIASEANEQTGYPFQTVDRQTGRVLVKRNVDPGNLELVPDSPVLYLSYFRRRLGLEAYDISTGKVIARVDMPVRMDRMAYDTARNELVVAAPADGKVWRFDANLRPVGSFKVMFGARTLAIDYKRNVLLVGSLTTGVVQLVDRSSELVIKSWYLGPWLRTIVLVPDQGIAYVSSNGALYKLRYAP